MTDSDGHHGENPADAPCGLSVEDFIRLAEYQRKQERRQAWKRRGRKFAIALTVPFAGPMAGEWWHNQERKGWR